MISFSGTLIGVGGRSRASLLAVPDFWVCGQRSAPMRFAKWIIVTRLLLSRQSDKCVGQGWNCGDEYF